MKCSVIPVLHGPFSRSLPRHSRDRTLLLIILVKRREIVPIGKTLWFDSPPFCTPLVPPALPYPVKYGCSGRRLVQQRRNISCDWANIQWGAVMLFTPSPMIVAVKVHEFQSRGRCLFGASFRAGLFSCPFYGAAISILVPQKMWRNLNFYLSWRMGDYFE